MSSILIRYAPLLLLAVAWELAARLELVSSSALPPLTDIVSAWFDLLLSGELITNGAVSLYRRPLTFWAMCGVTLSARMSATNAAAS